jgi:hypothetical protein
MIQTSTKHQTVSWSKSIALIAGFIAIGCSLDHQTAGTIRDTDTKIVATIFNPDGSPASGAKIKIFKSMDSTKIPIREIIADQNGKYSLAGLSNGSYSIFSQKDSLVAFRDLVNIIDSSGIIRNDTLQKPISFSSVVGLQPNHDPRTVTVQALGTDIYSNVDENGYFTLNYLGEGAYTLKFSTTIENYTSTFKQIVLNATIPGTLTDTFRLIYTGIPVVENIQAAYDTLNGVVRVTWKATTYKNFQDYLIYRDFFDSLNVSSHPLSFTNGTEFYDTVFHKNKITGAFSNVDTNDYQFKYRVLIENNSQEMGSFYKYAKVLALSPMKIRTQIVIKSFNKKVSRTTDTSSVNDSLVLIATWINQLRTNKKSTWHTSTDTLNIKKIEGSYTGIDSVIICSNRTGSYIVFFSITDASDRIWTDSIVIKVIKDIPEVAIISDTIFSMNDTIALSAHGTDKFGNIDLWEWSIDDSEFRKTSVPETVFVVTKKPGETYKIRLKGYNDDGNSAIDSVKAKVFLDWIDYSDKFPSEIRDNWNFNTPYMFDGHMFIINYGSLWMSDNGESWHKISDSLPFGNRRGFAIETLNNEVYLVGGYGEYSDSTNRAWFGYNSNNSSWACMLNDVWKSEDGINWVQIREKADFPPRANHSLLSFENKLWLIGGSTRPFSHPDGKYLNDIWISPDGINWTFQTTNIGTTAFHSTIIVNDIIYNIENGKVQKSNDGIGWETLITDANVISNIGPFVSSESFLGLLWLKSCGCKYTSTSDSSYIWYSNDGINWMLDGVKTGNLTESQNSLIQFQNHLWIFGKKIYRSK